MNVYEGPSGIGQLAIPVADLDRAGRSIGTYSGCASCSKPRPGLPFLSVAVCG
jgi:hypothetical protein